MLESSNRPAFVFVLSFVVFLFVGALQTCKGERRHSVLRKIEAEHLYATTVNTSHYDIRYVCKGAILYSWDVDRNALADPSPKAKLAVMANRLPTSSLTPGIETLLPFFGGVSGAWTVKDVLSASAEESFASAAKRIGAAFMGAASGYLAGAWLSQSSFTCDDPEILEHLAVPKSWLQLEQETLNGSLMALVQSDAGTLARLRGGPKGSLNRLIENSTPGGDVHSINFVAIASASREANASYGRLAHWERLLWYLSTTRGKTALGVCLGAGSLIVGAFVLLAKRRRRVLT